MNDTYNNFTISVRQFTILIVLGTIGDAILILPVIEAHAAKQDSWLGMLLGMLLGMATGGLFAAIAGAMGRRSIFGAVKRKAGGWAGSIVMLLFLFEFFTCCLSLLSEMSQFMTTQLMPETPATAIMVLFIAVVIIACRYGVEAFARMGELLFPFMLGLFAVLVLLLLPQVDFANLKPYAGTGFIAIGKGGYMAFLYVFAEMVILLMLVPYVKEGDKLTKPIMKGFALGGAVLFAIVLFCVLVLGPSLMETKYYPTFVLAQKITIGHFLERLEVIIAFLWITTVFYKTLLIFFALTEGIGQVLRLRENRMLAIPLGMILIVGTVAATPSITSYLDIVKNDYPWFDLTFCVGLPFLLLLILLIGGKPGGQQEQGQTQTQAQASQGQAQTQGQPQG